MNNNTKRVIFWVPRILCIFFALFISLFSFDVFGEGYGFWKTIGALLIHLIPTYIVIIATVIAWRWEWIGAILFTGLAIFYLVFAWGKFPLFTYLAISGPLFLVGGLFLINWIYKTDPRT